MNESERFAGFGDNQSHVSNGSIAEMTAPEKNQIAFPGLLFAYCAAHRLSACGTGKIVTKLPEYIRRKTRTIKSGRRTARIAISDTQKLPGEPGQAVGWKSRRPEFADRLQKGLGEFESRGGRHNRWRKKRLRKCRLENTAKKSEAKKMFHVAESLMPGKYLCRLPEICKGGKAKSRLFKIPEYVSFTVKLKYLHFGKTCF
jgi:hypothetical protein